MKTILKTIIISISIFGTTVCMALGVTVQKWTGILTPLTFLNRAILLAAIGLTLIILGVRTGAYTLRSILYEENLQLSNDIRLIVLFSLNGFGFGLLASALTLLIVLT